MSPTLSHAHAFARSDRSPLGVLVVDRGPLAAGRGAMLIALGVRDVLRLQPGGRRRG